MTKSFSTLALIGLCALGTATAALSAGISRSPVSPGQWSIDTTVIASGKHWNTHEICVKDDDTWYSTEQRKGGGRYIVTGNRVLLHSNFEILAVSADLAITSPTKMTGNLQQWLPKSLAANDMENLFTTSSWTWKSSTCQRPF